MNSLRRRFGNGNSPCLTSTPAHDHGIAVFSRTFRRAAPSLGAKLVNLPQSALLLDEAGDGGHTVPARRLLNTKGLATHMRLASRSITSSEAPTCAARSTLLMTRRSERVMPGLPLEGILSPAATSMT